MHLLPNTLLKGGTYQIVRFISSGGFGNTYEALDVNLDKRVAIKEFFVKDFCSRESDTTIVTIASTAKKPLIEHLKKKFIEEARAIANMDHENIVKVQALFEENGTAYYVMDYIDGESLSALLKRRGSLPENEAVAIILKVADALGYMHKQNRFHLDVKPANIMLRNDGKVILIDFGSSKQYAEMDGENTTTLAPCYTTGYAPSEQMNPKPTAFTAASDVYSLGATLYKMLTGQTPPSAIDLLNGEETLSSLPNELSHNVRECIEKSMIPQRNKRLQSVGDVMAFLQQFPKEDTLVGGVNTTESTEERIRRIAMERFQQEQALKKAEEEKLAEQKAIEEELERLRRQHENEIKIAKDKLSGKITFDVHGVLFNMIRVEGGTFDMKETVSCGFLGLSSKEVVQKTSLSDYYIGETQVTQALWKAVMGNNPSPFKGDSLPVETVSWFDCLEFISKLNSMTGRNFRLPTEAEWEFAARGGKNSNDYQYSGSNNLDEVAWYNGNSGYQTHEVATKQSNELGIYDMNGNVWEWCQDWYGRYSSSSQTNPTGPDDGIYRVLRGGGWCSSAGKCSSSYRGSNSPGFKHTDYSLRLALSE